MTSSAFSAAFSAVPIKKSMPIVFDVSLSRDVAFGAAGILVEINLGGAEGGENGFLLNPNNFDESLDKTRCNYIIERGEVGPYLIFFTQRDDASSFWCRGVMGSVHA